MWIRLKWSLGYVQVSRQSRVLDLKFLGRVPDGSGSRSKAATSAVLCFFAISLSIFSRSKVSARITLTLPRYRTLKQHQALVLAP